MIIDELVYQIKTLLNFAPTVEQSTAINTFADFYFNGGERSVMLLRGSAGTGKTSLASAMVKVVPKVVLLAPTGRAAKVFSIESGKPAFTAHHLIYRQKSIDVSGGKFDVDFNNHTDTLFVVDESSMISNSFSGGAFGTGRLLDDLVMYVYNGRNCRLMFIGDTAQLPPVGEELSPALCADEMRSYGLQVFETELSEVMRQSRESGILHNATLVRHLLEWTPIGTTPRAFPKMLVKPFDDIENSSGEELLENLSCSYSNMGVDETVVVTRSNKRANIFNDAIRSRIFEYDEELLPGDIVMIVKNNYHWTEKNQCGIDFIANGDRAIVRRIRNEVEQHGFRFADAILRFPDYDDMEIDVTLLLDTLHSDSPSLTNEQSEQLYNKVYADYADIRRKQDRIKKMRDDKYFNALQIKYGYAMTCHKAQGGQWAEVYVDQGYITPDMLSRDYLRWLYTAFTRATSHLHLVNWREDMIDE